MARTEKFSKSNAASGADTLQTSHEQGNQQLKQQRTAVAELLSARVDHLASLGAEDAAAAEAIRLSAERERKNRELSVMEGVARSIAHLRGHESDGAERADVKLLEDFLEGMMVQYEIDNGETDVLSGIIDQTVGLEDEALSAEKAQLQPSAVQTPDLDPVQAASPQYNAVGADSDLRAANAAAIQSIPTFNRDRSKPGGFVLNGSDAATSFNTGSTIPLDIKVAAPAATSPDAQPSAAVVDVAPVMPDAEAPKLSIKEKLSAERKLFSRSPVAYIHGRMSEVFKKASEKIKPRADLSEAERERRRDRTIVGIGLVAIAGIIIAADRSGAFQELANSFNPADVDVSGGVPGIDGNPGVPDAPPSGSGLDGGVATPDVDPATEPNSNVSADDLAGATDSPGFEADTGSYSEAASSVDAGEGWYQTFEDMNIPRAEWNNLLEKVGPELQQQGWASPMSGGSWGISQPGRLPESVLELIEESR